jgi:hypothetical protein
MGVSFCVFLFFCFFFVSPAPPASEDTPALEVRYIIPELRLTVPKKTQWAENQSTPPPPAGPKKKRNRIDLACSRCRGSQSAL